MLWQIFRPRLGIAGDCLLPRRITAAAAAVLPLLGSLVWLVFPVASLTNLSPKPLLKLFAAKAADPSSLSTASRAKATCLWPIGARYIPDSTANSASHRRSRRGEVAPLSCDW